MVSIRLHALRDSTNLAESRSCTKCNIVGPELKSEVQKAVDPGSTAGSNADDEEDDYALAVT